MSLTNGARRIEWLNPFTGFARRVALALLLAVVGTACRGSDAWLTSYAEAMAVAEETGKPVLAVFTGSDWCQHCRTLERNVLESREFRDWSTDRVILLMVDLPQEGISTEERKARSRICIKYGVRSFPNTVLIAPDGTAVTAQSGYRGQTTTTWLASFAEHTPIRTASVPTSKPMVHSSLVTATASARDTHKPILVMVSRPGDALATNLMNDPEFESLANEHFVVAQVPRAENNGRSAEDAAVSELFGDGEVPPVGVELVVTDDGLTPLFKDSCTQETRGVVSGLRRFLAARQGHSARR